MLLILAVDPDESHGHGEGHDDQGDGQREQPTPLEVVDHERGEEQPEDPATAGDAGPDADGPRSLLVGERRRDDRQGDGHDHCRRQTGHGPADEQHLGARRDGGGDAGRAEQPKAGEQDRSAPPAVADGADGQQEGGQGQRVGVDDPQQQALRRPELDRQVLERHVERRHGGDDGGEGEAHRDEDALAATRLGIGDHRIGWGIGDGHEVLPGIQRYETVSYEKATVSYR